MVANPIVAWEYCEMDCNKTEVYVEMFMLLHDIILVVIVKYYVRVLFIITTPAKELNPCIAEGFINIQV